MVSYFLIFLGFPSPFTIDRVIMMWYQSRHAFCHIAVIMLLFNGMQYRLR